MQQQASPIDAVSYLKFQLSLLQISSLGDETPQVEQLERLLTSQPGRAAAPKQ